MWWKVSPGLWAWPCLCADAQSQVQESDLSCRYSANCGGMQFKVRAVTGHTCKGSVRTVWAKLTTAGQGGSRVQPGVGGWVLPELLLRAQAWALTPLSSHQKMGVINTSCCGLSGDPQIHMLKS